MRDAQNSNISHEKCSCKGNPHKMGCEVVGKSRKYKPNSWDYVWNEYCKENPPFDNNKISFMEYLKFNYDPPIRK